MKLFRGVAFSNQFILFYIIFPSRHSVKLLKKDKNGSPESLSKLPQMAKQLEVSLYRNARSFEAYVDSSTLQARLQQIAIEVSLPRGARSSQGSSSSGGDKRDDRHWTERQQQENQFSNGSSRRPDGGLTQQRGSSSSSPFMGSSQPMQAQRGGVVTMDAINPMATSGARGHSSSSNYNSNSGRGLSSDQNREGSSGGSVPQNRNDPEWKIRIRHKQQRLLLLHHSAKCPHEDGRCTVTPHCADMKRLWRHMEGCKDNNCRVSHCFSSRAILSHYRKCKDANCPACGPVRDTVKKSSSRTPSQGGSSRSSRGQGISQPLNNNMMGGSSMNGTMGSNGMNNSVMPVGAPMGSSMNNNMSINSSMGGSNTMGNPMQRGLSGSINQPGMMTGDAMSSGGSFNSAHGMNNFANSSRGMPPPGGQNSSSGMPFNSNPSSQSQSPRYRANGQGSSSSTGPSSSSRDGSGSASVDPSASVTLPTSNTTGSSSKRNDSEWQKVRHKQQRLLLLRHASRCSYEAGKCPVTPHCASMKELWKHIAHCKDQQCSVQHCMSSRYVLSHYRRCKDAKCPACGPVRETIRKSHEKEKNTNQGPSSFDIDTSIRSKSQRPSETIQEGLGPTSAPSAPDSSPQSYEPQVKRSKTEFSSEVGSSGMNPIPATSIPQTVTPADAGSREAAPKNMDRSLLKSFTTAELERHLASLNRQTQLPPSKLKTKCLEVLKGLQAHQHGWVFNVPVDPVELGLPDYFNIIKKPMDLGTIHKRLDAGNYHDIENFKADTNLVFDNAMTYNEEGSVVYDMAKELKTKFEADYKKLLTQLAAEDKERRENDRACTLCGCEKLLFEPPVFFCNGMNCQSTRIRRNSHFYVGGNNQYFWCNQCYNELDDKIPIELVDMTISKADLKKKKNDEVHEESWVQCDCCERWVHQICGLFNTRQNKEHHSEYFCPQCLLDKRKAATAVPLPRPMGAADLPRTILSEWLEQHIRDRVDKRKRELAEEKANHEVRISSVFDWFLIPLVVSNLFFHFRVSEYTTCRGYEVRGIWWAYNYPTSHCHGSEA